MVEVGKKKTLIKPSYVDDFACSGQNCKYTCCQKWRIIVQRKEYDAIKKLPLYKEKSADKSRIFQRVRENASDYNYATVLLNEHMICPLLNESKLCSLQLAHGAEALPRTCRVFPREYSRISNTIRMCMSTGCEEVVHKLMTQSAGLAFKEETVEKIPKDMGYYTWYAGAADISKHPAMGFHNEISFLGLWILGQSQVKLEDRILMLGTAMYRLSTLETEGKTEEIPFCIKELMEEIQKGQLFTEFEKISGNKRLQISNAVEMMNLFFERGLPPEFKKRFLSRLGMNLEVSVDIAEQEHGLYCTLYYNVDLVQEALRNLDGFLAGREYVLDNIITNWFFYLNIPFYIQDKTIWENTMAFISVYHMFKYLLAGYIDEKQKDEDFVHAVVVSSRILNHGKQSFEKMLDHMVKNGTTTLAHMAILIK